VRATEHPRFFCLALAPKLEAGRATEMRLWTALVNPRNEATALAGSKAGSGDGP
jgi:hypothetical protein